MPAIVVTVMIPGIPVPVMMVIAAVIMVVVVMIRPPVPGIVIPGIVVPGTVIPRVIIPGTVRAPGIIAVRPVPIVPAAVIPGRPERTGPPEVGLVGIHHRDVRTEIQSHRIPLRNDKSIARGSGYDKVFVQAFGHECVHLSL